MAGVLAIFVALYLGVGFNGLARNEVNEDIPAVPR